MSPSGSDGIPHFPTECRSSDGPASAWGTAQPEEGDQSAKKGLFCETAEQVPGAGRPGWQRFPEAAMMLCDAAFPSAEEVSNVGRDPKSAA